MKVLEILPQKIFKFKCDPDLIKKSLINLEDEDWKDHEEWQISQSADVRLNKNPKYFDLYKWIKKCLMEVKNELNFKCTRLEITQSWANTSQKGQSMWSHAHPNSFVSGILYLTNSNASTIFSMDSIWTNYYQNTSHTLQLKTTDHDDLLVTHKQQTVQGDLIIFPSNLVHTVDDHDISDYDRYTISFNSFPAGVIGDMSNLSGLMIEVF